MHFLSMRGNCDQKCFILNAIFFLDKSKYTVTKYTLNGCVYEKFERIPGTESDEEEKEDETEDKIDEIPPPLVKAETSTIETIEESSTLNPILVEEFEEDSGPKDFRVNCPECGKEMNRRSITRHCKDVHGSDFTTGDLVPEDGGFKGKRVICPGKYLLLSGFQISILYFESLQIPQFYYSNSKNIEIL